MIEGSQMLDTTTVASLAILLSSARVTQMPKMLEPRIRVVAAKAVAIKAMVVAIIGVIGRPLVDPMLWMPMSSRGIRLISLWGINQAIWSACPLG